MSAVPVIEISNLSKSFGNNHVLKNFDMTLYSGENLAILGKSGSGKSVLIKCIIGLFPPDSGTIKVFGKNIPELNRDELDIIRIRMGFLFQNNALYDSMTVRENLEFPLRVLKEKKTRQETDALVKEMLTNVGLAHTVDMMPSELSGGMRKRIGLARTLMLNPDIILYDEPTTGLDPITGREISHLMVEMQKKYHASSMLITHDMDSIKIVSDRIILLWDGKRYADGTYNVLKDSSDSNLQQFFNHQHG